MLSRLSRVRITLGYAAVLIGVSAALVDLGPRVRAHVIAQASTNLHNLAHGHLGHAARQRVRHRRRADVLLAAVPGLPAGAGRTDLA